MTTEELKKAIDILAGQGNQVDCGGQLKDILYNAVGFIPGIEEVKTKEITQEQYIAARTAGFIRIQLEGDDKTYVSAALPEWAYGHVYNLVAGQFPEIQSIGDIKVFTENTYYGDGEWSSGNLLIFAVATTTDGQKYYMKGYEI